VKFGVAVRVGIINTEFHEVHIFLYLSIYQMEGYLFYLCQGIQRRQAVFIDKTERVPRDCLNRLNEKSEAEIKLQRGTNTVTNSTELRSFCWLSEESNSYDNI
jgi:hypothetical protein